MARQFSGHQAHIGDAAGLTPVHVNRTLQGLRRDGVLRTADRTVHFDDWEGLAAIADFDPGFLPIDRTHEQQAA